jgi:Protein of unknown function (DUF1364)
MFRSRALLKLARGAPCLIAIPGICRGDQDSVVACHGNWSEHGKGVGLKAHDCFIAFGCIDCHRAIDKQAYQLEPDDRRYYWQRGFERTILWLFENGKLRVKP